MKIAIVGSNTYSIPLNKGKIHAPLLLTWNLANRLASFGHEVTYYGLVDKNNAKVEKGLKIVEPTLLKSSGLKSSGKKLNSSDKSNLAFLSKVISMQDFIAKILLDSDNFDIFYSWFASYVGPLAGMCKKPVVVTHHDSTNMDKYNIIFQNQNYKNVFMIPISKYMNRAIVYKNMLKVVHHGIDENIIVQREPEDYYCWMGRVAPQKGLHIAIRAAIKAKVNLKIIGPMHDKLPDFGDIKDYITDIKQMIAENDNIEYLGVFTQEESYGLVSRAKALIFPTDGVESFSMVTAEAVMAGTPVIATKKGPIPEIIINGLNGFLIKDRENIDEFVNAIGKIDKIDRDKCRKNAINRFSLDKMARGYEKQFEVAIKKWRKNAKN